MLQLNTENLPPLENSVGQCQVINLGSGVPPKEIIVELPHSDGARIKARWSGFPPLSANDYVRIQYRQDETLPEVVSTSAGTSAQAATISFALGNIVTYEGIVVTNDDEVVWYI